MSKTTYKQSSSAKKCITRRSLLKTAGCAGAAALVIGMAGKAGASLNGEYPQVRIANIMDMEVGRPLTFDYPLRGRKNVLVDMGCAVEGGAGPYKSIVAYSMFCSHLGCSVDLDAESGNLICECHQTVYDPRRSGRVIEGPAPSSLPMIMLDMDDTGGDIYAVGVAGLIYGLRNNLRDGEEVR